MQRHPSQVDQIRARRTEFENHLIDELADGGMDRREFARRATTLGMSLPLVALLVQACGGPSSSSSGTQATSSGGAVKQGGTIRIGAITPARKLDPLTLGDNGSVGLVSQVGEYLTLNPGKTELTPLLAESWKPNADASVWTFKLRSGVQFNDGSPMRAQDVAATFNRLADPKNGTNALEVFQGVLSKGGVSAIDDSTVRFELDAPTGAFPWLVSSDNDSAIVLPESYDGNWEKSWVGTGPWTMESYTPKVRASFVRNDKYWGDKAIADRVEYTFFEDEVAMILALQAKNIDVVSNFGVTSGRPILKDGGQGYKINALRSSAHAPMYMRVDRPPLGDKRVRQAISLCLDRRQLVDSLLSGYADIGNDSPFAPVFTSTDTSVPQRDKDIAKAKQLMAEAGQGNGFSVQVNVWDTGANSAFAQILQNAVKEIGIDVKLVVQDTETFLGTGEYGSSPQLDSTVAISDWGSRGVPNAFLTAQLKSDGVRNASHWHNQEFDRLYREYVGEADVSAQRKLAGKIQTLLLDETPIIYPYFTKYLTATLPTVSGVVPTAMGQMLVNKASVSA
jgi:peptide/nickel transport system substrate-binding protein